MSAEHLKNLNTEQQDIVDHFTNKKVSSICIIAGAGVGKTKTIIAGIVDMIKVHKRNPEFFLVTTFTKNAASELKERLLDHLSESEVDKVVGTDQALTEQTSDSMSRYTSALSSHVFK